MSNQAIISPERAFRYFKGRLAADVEEVWALALTSTKTPIAAELIFRGTVDRCLVHPRDIFRFAIHHNASSLIIAHNHPSGDVSPSTDDREVTKQMIQAGELLQIPLDDHLILSGFEKFYSFALESDLFFKPSVAAS